MKPSDEILCIESELAMPFMKLPVKMILIKVSSGVVLISPLPDLEKFLPLVNNFGEVTDIVAPSLFHHLGIKKAIENFPKAQLWGVKGIEKKCPGLSWKFIDEKTWPYSLELSLHPLKGMPKVNEVDFFHKQSKSLIVTDLCFNFTNGKGFGYWFVFNIFGTYKKFAISRLFLKMVQDQILFEDSIHKILELDFEKIIIPHGENVEEHAKEKLRLALKERKVI